MVVSPQHKGAAKLEIGHHGGTWVDELRVQGHPGARPRSGSAWAMIAKLQRLLDRKTPPHGQLHGSRDQIGHDRVEIEDEAHLDLVDLRSPVDVAVVGLEDDGAARDIVFYEMVRCRQNVGSVRERCEASLVAQKRVLEQVLRERRGEVVGEHRVGVQRLADSR